VSGRDQLIEVAVYHPPAPETDQSRGFEHTDASDGKTDIGLDLGDRQQLVAARAASAPVAVASRSVEPGPAGQDRLEAPPAQESATDVTLRELEDVLAQIVGILDQLDMPDEADFTP